MCIPSIGVEIISYEIARVTEEAKKAIRQSWEIPRMYRYGRMKYYAGRLESLYMLYEKLGVATKEEIYKSIKIVNEKLYNLIQ